MKVPVDSAAAGQMSRGPSRYRAVAPSSKRVMVSTASADHGSFRAESAATDASSRQKLARVARLALANDNFVSQYGKRAGDACGFGRDGRRLPLQFRLSLLPYPGT